MKTITVAELKHRLDKGEVILVDVREPAEYRTTSIQGAFLMPLASVSHEKLPSTSCPIVLHCRSGKRSIMACQTLLQQNPHLDVYSLEGGIEAWEQAGYAVERCASHFE